MYIDGSFQGWPFKKNQRLLIKSRNYHALEMEAQPPHMTFLPHHLDLS